MVTCIARRDMNIVYHTLQHKSTYLRDTTLVAIGDKSIVPRLLEKAEHDPFIVVRHAAFRGLQTLTGQQIEALRIEQWKAWWTKNKDIWPPKK